jgi:hypothetical protein
MSVYPETGNEVHGSSVVEGSERQKLSPEKEKVMNFFLVSMNV